VEDVTNNKPHEVEDVEPPTHDTVWKNKHKKRSNVEPPTHDTVCHRKINRGECQRPKDLGQGQGEGAAIQDDSFRNKKHSKQGC